MRWLLVASNFAFFSKIVIFSVMTSSRKQHDSTLQSALQAARENENRWLEMQAEFYTDSETMAQWASTAKLRRLEVERLEAALAEAEKE
jgi:hypothetical protein